MYCTESTVPSLESILEDPNSTLFKEFATYLHQSYCIENLAFWLATQEYYEECNNKQRQQQLCETMISLYILPNSPQEINIPCEMRQSILDYYYGGNLHLHIFDDAAEAVLELMRVNSFLPWAAINQGTSSSPTKWSFDSSEQASTTSKTAKHHKSWTTTRSRNNNKKSVINNSLSTTSLTGLTTSFSFTDKWNLIKLKQQSSRRSCSSLDYTSSFDDDNRLALSIDSTNLFSVPSATTTATTTTTTTTATTTTTNTSGTRYKTMLRRVKKSLLGSSTSDHQDNDSSDEYSTPRSSFTADTSSWTTWRKSQR